MMTPSSLFSALAPSIPGGDIRPLTLDPSTTAPAATKSFSTVMSEVHDDGDANASKNRGLAMETPTVPDASDASTLKAVMARPHIPTAEHRKTPSAQAINSKGVPAGQANKSQSAEKTPDREAATDETPEPLATSAGEETRALPTLMAGPPSAQTVNSKSTNIGAEDETRPLVKTSDRIAASDETHAPLATPPDPALLAAMTQMQVAAGEFRKPVSNQPVNSKVAPAADGDEPRPLTETSVSSQSIIASKPGAATFAPSSASENKPAKTVDSHPTGTAVSKKEPTAQPAELAGSPQQPIAAQVSIPSQMVSISADPGDGTGGALSSQRMNFEGKKNEIAGHPEQKVPTAPQKNDFSVRAASEAALGSDSEHTGPKQDSIDSALVLDLSNKSTELTDVSRGTGVAPSVDNSAAQAERVGHLVNQQVTMMRQSGANNLAVSLKVDPHTELSLQLTNHNGQIEASVRWERGSSAGLGNHWKDLQESLGRLNVQLLPLKNEVSSRTSAFNSVANATPSSYFNQTSQNPQRQSRQAQEDLPLPDAFVAVPATATTKTATRTASRQGWESWA